MIEPAYDSYAPAVELCGGKVVPYELQAPDYEINWQEFAEGTEVVPNTNERLWNGQVKIECLLWDALI